MKYRRFGRTGLAMPVLSCGGMRYQFKWQDVQPNEIPPAEPGEPRGRHPPRPRAGHQPHRNRARLRHLGNAVGPHPPHPAPREDHRPNQGQPQADREGIPAHVRHLAEIPAARSRGPAGAARHQQPPAPASGAPEGRLRGRGAQAPEGRPRPLHRLLHPRDDRHHPRSDPERGVRLREPALVFRERPELAGGRGRAGAGHGGVHHQPERQRRKALRAAAESWWTCARR